jgi:2-oxoglutarate ferredoxin oxidoreductase subunit beta
MELKMDKVAARPKLLYDQPTHYCPGCTHGVVHKILCDVLTELDIAGQTIGVVGIGCSAPMYAYIDIDWVATAHGRAPAVATGLVREYPSKVVFTYQGDGDLASIGLSEIFHAANRGERLVVIFVNNAIYGMTGGQMAPTTLAGQRTTTNPEGRDVLSTGFPIKITELLAQLPGVTYAARVAGNTPGNIRKAKLSLRKAFQNQMYNRGLSIVEILSICPTNWGMTPENSLVWLKEQMVPYYPLGEMKSPEGGLVLK